MATSGQTISSEALRIFRHHHFVRKWGKKVFFVIYYHIFLHGQPKKIHEILKENGLSGGRRSCFKPHEITNLKTKPPEDLDITAMYKICEKLWQKGVKDRGDRIKGLVKQIKDERNIVSHEDLLMSQTDLESKINDFQIVLEDTLDEARMLFPYQSADIDQLRTDMQDAVPKLLEKIRERYDPADPDDIAKLQDEIKDFWDELFAYIQELSREEARTLYEDLCKISLFDWLAQYDVTDPCAVMVKLMFHQDKIFHGNRINSQCPTVDQDEILDITDDEGNDPKVIIISGNAGSGKTTLLCYIVENWCKDMRDNMTDLSSFQILLYMQFRNHSYDSVDSYLQTLLPKTVSPFDLKHVKSSIVNSKVLILCDGYNERNVKSEKLFQEMLALNCKDMKIVVTTRPGSTGGLTQDVNKAKRTRLNLKILGLKRQDMVELTVRIPSYVLKDDVTRIEETKRDLLQIISNIDVRMMKVLKTPLYFNLFILLCIECPDTRESITSVSSLYIQLRKHMNKRIIEKTGIKEEALDTFDRWYKDISLQKYNKNEYELSKGDVDTLYSEIKDEDVLQNFNPIMSSYFNVKHTKNGLEIEEVYCYRHRTEQEVAVASIICEDIVERRKMQDTNNEFSVLLSNRLQWDNDLGEYAKVKYWLRYIVGILYNSNREVLYEVANDIHKLLLQCSEKEYIDNNDIVLNFLLMPWKETRFDQRVLSSLASVLNHTPRHYTLKITVNALRDDGENLRALLSLLPELDPSCTEIYIELWNRPMKYLHVLMDSLNVANQRRFHVHLEFALELDDMADSERPDSFCLVDVIDLNVYGVQSDVDTVRGHVRDISKLYQFPISGKEQNIVIFWQDSQDKEATEMKEAINEMWPRKIEDQSTSLTLKLSTNLCKRDRIELLLESLTFGPFEKFEIHGEMGVVRLQEHHHLKNLSRERGLGKLALVNYENTPLVRGSDFVKWHTWCTKGM